MRLKAGVRVHGIIPEMVLASCVADEIWKDLCGHGVTITSVIDGRHTKFSRHYWGGAIDLRTHDLENIAKIMQAVELLKARLGDDYKVIYEEDHIHVSWKPLRSD